MMSAELRYLFGPLGTDVITAELPLSGVSMSNKLNDWGTFRGTMNLDASGLDNADVVAATLPGRNFVICERDGVPVWDGIVWSRVYNSDSKIMNLSGRTYEAYADHLLIDVDFVASNQEQRNVFCNLWLQLQGPSGRNLGINIPAATFPTTVPRSLSILASEFKTFYSGMTAMADGEDGFDWTIKTIRENDHYRRDLQIGYPFLGTSINTGAPGLAFEFPGNILNYYATESMSNAGTRTYLLGAGEGTTMVNGLAIQADLENSGHKRFDVTVSRKDIDDFTTAQSLADRLGLLRRPPMVVTKVFLKADIEPVFGSYNLGDTATLAIVDPRYPAGVTVQSRIVAWEYRPQSDDTVDQVELVFEGDELNEE